LGIYPLNKINKNFLEIILSLYGIYKWDGILIKKNHKEKIRGNCKETRRRIIIKNKKDEMIKNMKIKQDKEYSFFYSSTLFIHLIVKSYI
jgi:hypothetical protein